MRTVGRRSCCNKRMKNENRNEFMSFEYLLIFHSIHIQSLRRFKKIHLKINNIILYITGRKCSGRVKSSVIDVAETGVSVPIKCTQCRQAIRVQAAWRPSDEQKQLLQSSFHMLPGTHEVEVSRRVLNQDRQTCFIQSSPFPSRLHVQMLQSSSLTVPGTQVVSAKVK